MAFFICIETFQGELPDGVHLRAEQFQTVLDDSKSAEALLLRKWSRYFAPVASTYVYPDKPKVKEPT